MKIINKKLQLNIGCGNNILKGFTNIDKIQSCKEIVQLDLNKFPLPYKDNSVDFILCEHLLSYLNNPVEFIYEIYRISKPNAKIKLIVNHFSLAMSYAELRKKRSGFSYFTFGNKNWNNEFKNMFEVKKRFNFTRVNQKWMNFFINPLINSFPIIYERFFCYIIPCSEIIFDLEVIKND